MLADGSWPDRMCAAGNVRRHGAVERMENGAEDTNCR